MTATTVQDISIDLISDPPVLLRPVRKQSAEYMEMRDSIAEHGLLNSISVRPHPTDAGRYQLIEGNYRLNCCRDLGHQTIPCIVMDATDADILLLQVVANAVRPETLRTEYAQQLKLILNTFPELTVPDLAIKIGKSVKWVYEQLSLLDIKKCYHLHVDRGEMTLNTAYMFAKLPPAAQDKYIDQALTLSPREFRTLAISVIRQYMEAVRMGKLESVYCTEEFKPTPYLRNLSDLTDELESMEAAGLVLMQDECQTLPDAWKSALQWVVHLDKRSVAEQRKRMEERHNLETQRRIRQAQEELES